MKRPDGITVIAIWHFFLAVLSLLALCTFISIPAFGLLSDLESEGLFGITAVFSTLGCFFLLETIMTAVTGFGLWRMQNWGRYLAIFLAIFTLFAFPVGTIIGAVILWYLFQEEVKNTFELAVDPDYGKYAEMDLDEIPPPDEDFEYKFYPPKGEAEEAEEEPAADEAPAEASEESETEDGEEEAG